jgi:hypothetical protein
MRRQQAAYDQDFALPSLSDILRRSKPLTRRSSFIVKMRVKRGAAYIGAIDDVLHRTHDETKPAATLLDLGR